MHNMRPPNFFILKKEFASEMKILIAVLIEIIEA